MNKPDENDIFAPPRDPIAELDIIEGPDPLEEYRQEINRRGVMKENFIEQDLDDWLDEQVQ